METSNFLIAVDLGSNSFHMIIATEQAGCIKVLYTQKQRVNQGSGLNENGMLSEEAIVRGLECLESFGRSFNSNCKSIVRIVATHTLRLAINRDQFIERAFRIFPHRIEVISGKMEAELIYQGVAHTYPLKGKTLVIDMGGGSTEVIIGSGFESKWVESLEIGAGSLQRRFFAKGVIDQGSMDKAQFMVASLLLPHMEPLTEQGWHTAVGTSGSIKMIANIMQELYDDRFITAAHLADLRQKLIDWGHIDKININGIDLRRIPQLPGVVALLSEVFDKLPIEAMDYCSGSLREGVLYGLSESCQLFDPRHRTITNLANLHGVDDQYSRRVVLQLEQFFGRLDSRDWFFTPVERHFAIRAALLHEVGLSIDFKKRQNHGAYIIENSVMPGFDTAEQLVIAALVGNHRGKITVDWDLLGVRAQRFQAVLQLLRLAILLTRGRADAPPWSVDLHFEPPTLVLTVGQEIASSDILMYELQQEITAQEKAGMALRVDIKPLESETTANEATS